MQIEPNSPLWAHLADWVKVLFTLPDPPPEIFRQVNEAVILTTISALSQRLSPELGAELRKAVPALSAQLKAAA